MQTSHWNGKTWYAYGTSMTSVKQGKYVPLVADYAGMNVVNKGIPGGSLTPDGYGKGNLKQAVMDMSDGKKNADLITLEVLPNEGNIAGHIYDTDDCSFCGCLNQCLRALQENTTAQIVMIVMILGNDHPPEQIREGRGMTDFEFAELAIQVAKLNGIPVINAFSESGFGYARVKSRNYQIDNIHLNGRGGTNMANFIWSKLKDIPLFE